MNSGGGWCKFESLYAFAGRLMQGVFSLSIGDGLASRDFRSVGGRVARQNIDERWKTDPRRTALAARTSGRNADAMRVEINWLLLDYKGEPVPLKVFKYVQDWQEWVDCGLAEIVGEMVRIAGADEYSEFFDKQRVNGSKGGRPKKPTETQINPTETHSNPNNPSFSSSFSFSKKEKKERKNKGMPILQSANPDAVVNLVQVYCDEWRAKTGKSPSITGKDAGMLSRLGKDLGAARATALIKAYFAMPNAYYFRRGYPVSLLSTDLSAIQQFEATGKVVTGAVVHELEKRVDKVQGTGRRRSLMDLAPESDVATLQLTAGGDDDSAA